MSHDHHELTERPDAMLGALPENSSANAWDAWEQGVISAEEYWFGLSEALRRGYGERPA
jgi:hypothetical protein